MARRTSWLVLGGALAMGACTEIVRQDAPDAGVRWLAPPPTAMDATAPPPADAGVDSPVDLTDFHVPGTQIGDIDASNFVISSVCSFCHSSQNGTVADMESSPHETWSGSLMANAGRDPLFFAQMTNANQDVPGVGYYCLRCHVPMTVATGHAYDWRGGTLDSVDRDGVACHLCHAMIDPRTTEASAVSPMDLGTLASLADPPKTFGNAQFVVDPSWLRRGPYDDAMPLHPWAVGPQFLHDGALCGTCHDVGNLAVSKLSNGSYAYNLPHQQAPDPDPRAQFPLERTFTEWNLSAYSGEGTTCQSCHMPRATGKGCFNTSQRPDLARHDFAGASAWVLGIIDTYWGGMVDHKALVRGQANAVAMLKTAASLALSQQGSTLSVRVTNLSGHKLPTGHIEGRRVWVNVKMKDAANNVVAEYGKWDPTTGDLDTSKTTVFEMHIGLSDAASKLTGLPPGPTTHMSLADVIVKDSRIPPRGFSNATFAAAGAGAVGATYADGQNWADTSFAIPNGGKHATVTLEYQTVTREYIDALEKGNHTDTWGTTLAGLWQGSGRDAPVDMVVGEIDLN